MEICRSWRSLIVIVCIVPLILAVIIMGGSTIHPCWERRGGEWRIYQVFGVGFCPITLHIFITMLSETDHIPQNIPRYSHI